MNFDYIIPLGSFCSVASELEEAFLREHSLPLDWVISDLKAINTLIPSRFTPLFDPDKLHKDAQHPHIVKHSDFVFDFYHDFPAEKSIEEVLPRVKQKYMRRVDRFYSILSSRKNLLFVRYIFSTDTASEIDCLIDELKGMNPNIRFLFFKHPDIELGEIRNSRYILKTILVEPDKDDYFSRKFLKKPDIRRQLKLLVNYPKAKYIRNAYFYIKKAVKMIPRLIAVRIKRYGLKNSGRA